ncbi:helix-turn-helix domain-containing protein [Streptomyces sp. NPDC002889]|uniref:helix-turn-helix domain-containing protein n=1 Tax=Streptomyces sp. NPDC002889 TaxID=3364669 RepID=UPI00368A8BFC
MSAARETEAFARRLREIRDGSGRSYGALARRVGVGASTLHRYCSGRTVPLEFAPVERLARLCGCDGEELVALHRMWIRADVERRSRQENGEGAGRVPAAAGDKALVSPPGTGGASGPQDSADMVAGPVTGRAADVVPGHGADVTAGGSAAQGQDGPADAATAPDVATGPRVSAVLLGEDPADSEASAPGALPVRIGRFGPLRRRRTVYAAALVTTTILTLVLLMAFDRSPLLASDGQRTTARQPAGGHSAASAAPGDEAGAEGLASPDTKASGPSDGPSGSTGTPRPGSGAASPRPTSTSRPGGSATPFTWKTGQHVWENGCDHAYAVNRGPGAVPPPPAESDAGPWARSLGAVHAGNTLVRITVQGRSDKAVVLQALRVRVTARRTPPNHNVYRMSSGCGGSITPRLFDTDLDAPRPLARSVPGNDSGEPIPAVSFPYKVSATDPEILLVTGRTVTCDCDWYLELEWSSGDRSGTIRIDDAGRPFRTSGIRGRPVYDYDHSSGGWVPAE